MGVYHENRYLNVNVQQYARLIYFDGVWTSDGERTYPYSDKYIYIGVTFEHVDWQSRVKIYHRGSFLRDSANRDTSKYSAANMTFTRNGNNITLKITSSTTVGYFMVLAIE